MNQLITPEGPTTVSIVINGEKIVRQLVPGSIVSISVPEPEPEPVKIVLPKDTVRVICGDKALQVELDAELVRYSLERRVNQTTVCKTLTEQFGESLHKGPATAVIMAANAVESVITTYFEEAGRGGSFTIKIIDGCRSEITWTKEKLPEPTEFNIPEGANRIRFSLDGSPVQTTFILPDDMEPGRIRHQDRLNSGEIPHNGDVDAVSAFAVGSALRDGLPDDAKGIVQDAASWLIHKNFQNVYDECMAGGYASTIDAATDGAHDYHITISTGV